MQINNNPSFGARRISIEMITKNATKNGKKTRKPMEASFIKWLCHNNWLIFDEK